MHQNRGINRTFVPIIVRVGLTLPVFPSVYYQHRIIRRTTPGQNRYAMTFQELNLIEPLKRAVAEKGYTTPTPIQQQAIPPALEGRDLMGCAQTGTGKTAAFTLPILQLLAAEPRTKGRRTIKALVLTPTRELAAQIDECCRDYARYTDIRHCVIFGGVNQRPQVDALQRGIDLLVATPGRLLDHLRRGTLDLSQVNKVVLDEADEMMKLGFIEDVELLLSAVAPDRQFLLFSATMPERVKGLARAYMKAPEDITVKGEHVTLENIEQEIIDTREETKLDTLCDVINRHQPYLAMVFCHTKARVHQVTMALAARGYLVDELHGDLTQVQRSLVLKRFRTAKLQILVATDIAARGLDIEGVTHVVNYDIPRDTEAYIHRIGRTGRAGEKGVAITFVNARQYTQLRRIEAGIKARIEKAHAERHRQHEEKQAKIKAQIVQERRAQQPAKKPLSKYANRKGADHKGYNGRSRRASSVHGRTKQKSNVGHRSKMGGRRK